MRYRLNEFSRQARERRSGSRWIQYHWRKTWRDWMNRRLPPAQKVKLNHRNIFISPTRAGAAYLGLCLVLLLIAINFQNSAVYALTFTLSSVFVVSIFHTFRNLSGVTVSASATKPVFAGNEALFTSTLSTYKSCQHFSLCLSWQNKESAYVDVVPGKDEFVNLRFQVGPRGLCKPGRVKVESRYPFGLLSARSYVDVSHEVIVYPFPVDHGNENKSSMNSMEQGRIERTGTDDFFGLRDYQQGDKVRNIAWRNYAKNDRLVVKQFVDYFDHRNCFNWTDLQGNTEQRLSQLAYWAVESESNGEQYAVSLPGVEIPTGQGSMHLSRVLQTLALFGKQETPQTENNYSKDIDRLHLVNELQTAQSEGAL